MTGTLIHRRNFLGLAGLGLSLPFLPCDALAAVETEVPLHGISPFGDLKYGADFKHFEYANPDAPTGGTFNFAPPNWVFNQSVLTFNTLNTFVPRGDAPPRMEMCFDSLFSGALDEPGSAYGRLAETVTIAADRNSFTFKLRPQARFHDGSSITAEDVAFSYVHLKEHGHPSLVLPLTHMAVAEAVDDHTFRIAFSGEQSSRTIFSVIGYPILSKAYTEANAFGGSPMTPLLGSGPYKVGRVIAGQSIEYDRFDDYWGHDLPVNVGLNHFDRIRIEFYRERQAAFEAFKKGDIHYRQEFTSRVWATGYDFPAIIEGKVVKREFPAELRPSMQAWAVNQRRPRFADVRTRRAIAMCFDFEWTNRNLFFGAYTRSNSCFEKSDFKAEGPPSREELALLEPYRDELPAEAFGEAYVQPPSDGSGRDRRLLREARRLLMEAGWKQQGAFLANDAGERLAVEIMVNDDTFVRIDTPFMENMRTIGIDASIRLVDSAQYQARQIDFDFDMVSLALSFSSTPTYDELANIFHSRSVDVPSSRNLPGVASPAIDALVEAAGRAESREELTTAMRAIDRVLRARMDWIPNWYAANHRAAFWDMFGFREPKPDYGFPVESLWWYDEQKAKAIGKA